MENKAILGEKVEIVYKTDDGRTNIVDGEISSSSKEFFVVKAFKRVILSLDQTRYDLFEVTSSTNTNSL